MAGPKVTSEQRTFAAEVIEQGTVIAEHLAAKNADIKGLTKEECLSSPGISIVETGETFLLDEEQCSALVSIVPSRTIDNSARFVLRAAGVPTAIYNQLFDKDGTSALQLRVDVLAEEVKDEWQDWDTVGRNSQRVGIAYELSDIGSAAETAVPRLQSVLLDNDDTGLVNVRIAVATALHSIGTKDAFKALELGISSLSREMTGGYFDSTRADAKTILESIIGITANVIINSQDPVFKTQAITTLGQIGAQSTRTMLVVIESDSTVHETVRKAARNALHNIDRSGVTDMGENNYMIGIYESRGFDKSEPAPKASEPVAEPAAAPRKKKKVRRKRERTESTIKVFNGDLKLETSRDSVRLRGGDSATSRGGKITVTQGKGRATSKAPSSKPSSGGPPPVRQRR